MVSDALIKFANTFGAVAGFLAIVLLVFYAAGRATGRISRPLTSVVFLGPAIVLLLVGLVIPAIGTFVLSLKNADGDKFIGGENFSWAFSSDSIREVFLNTLLWIIVAPAVTTVLGLAIAILVDRMRRQAIYKSLIFLPMAISFVGASFIWRFVY